MIVVYLMIGLLCGAIAIPIAQAKGREGGSGFLLGFLLGPIGILIVAILSPNTKALEDSELRSGIRKRCPDCAETVLKEARKCKHCGYQFEQPVKAQQGEKPERGSSDRAVRARRMFRP